MKQLSAVLTLGLMLAAAAPLANAGAFANSLWIGNDTNASLGVLNTDRTGTILQTIPGISAVGIAVDLGNGLVYVNGNFASATPYDLAMFGISCISPIAPTGDTASASKSDSVRITDLMRSKLRRYFFAASAIISS